MSATTDGGPAFPSRLPKHHDQHLLDNINPGMTLRDWFAGMAIQGASQWVNQHEAYHSKSLADNARESYLIADAMIAARERKHEPAPPDLLGAMTIIRTIATAPHHPNAINAVATIAANAIAEATGKEMA